LPPLPLLVHDARADASHDTDAHADASNDVDAYTNVDDAGACPPRPWGSSSPLLLLDDGRVDSKEDADALVDGHDDAHAENNVDAVVASGRLAPRTCADVDE
jgi:hypothetical protein